MLIAAYKPPQISSNAFLSILKKQFHHTKGGYLGTLDPFAQGTLIVGFNRYTRLFPHLLCTPKSYRAVLWLGANSESLDIERITRVCDIKPFKSSHVQQVLESFKGEITYTPPLFSAKHINGKRAYELARKGEVFTIPISKMSVYSIRLLHYAHPFLHFEVNVSKGAYIRSLGALIAQKLDTQGALCFLERTYQGAMCVSQMQKIVVLNPIKHLPYKILKLNHLKPSERVELQNNVAVGKKIVLKNIQKGKYIVCFDEFFSIINILNSGDTQYILNRMPYADTFTQTR